MTAADLVIDALAESEADLKEANRQLVDLVADLSLENATLRMLYERERISRLYGDALIARLHRQRRERRAA